MLYKNKMIKNVKSFHDLFWCTAIYLAYALKPLWTESSVTRTVTRTLKWNSRSNPKVVPTRCTSFPSGRSRDMPRGGSNEAVSYEGHLDGIVIVTAVASVVPLLSALFCFELAQISSTWLGLADCPLPPALSHPARLMWGTAADVARCAGRSALSHCPGSRMCCVLNVIWSWN